MRYDLLIADLTKQEELRHTVYDDATGESINPGTVVVGHPTIGIGRAVDAVNGITTPEAVELCVNDINTCVEQLSEFPFFALLNDARQDALIDIVFNMGIVHFKGFTRAIRALAASDFKSASVNFLDSKWAKQEPVRSKVLAEQLETGVRS
jgi:lysozyme